MARLKESLSSLLEGEIEEEVEELHYFCKAVKQLYFNSILGGWGVRIQA